jgi:hypothetical protein
MEDDGAWWVDHSAEEGEVAEEGRLPRALTVRAFAGSLRLQKGPDFLESVNKNRTLKIKGRFQLHSATFESAPESQCAPSLAMAVAVFPQLAVALCVVLAIVCADAEGDFDFGGKGGGTCTYELVHIPFSSTLLYEYSYFLISHNNCTRSPSSHEWWLCVSGAQVTASRKT